MEQVLLSCGIFVCLAGVMFESDRFSAEEDGSNEPGKASFEWQREVIVYAGKFFDTLRLVKYNNYLFFLFISLFSNMFSCFPSFTTLNL